MAPTYGGDPKALEPGAWSCSSCGNLNYAGRTTCNSRGCGKPAPRQQQQQQQRQQQQSWGMSPYGHSPGAPNLYSPVEGKGGRPSPPEGSWICSTCNNVNWPTRDTCNAKHCGQPRHLADGGAPPRPGEKAAPEGSWTCQGCQNVNYPTRTVCNKRNC